MFSYGLPLFLILKTFGLGCSSAYLKKGFAQVLYILILLLTLVYLLIIYMLDLKLLDDADALTLVVCKFVSPGSIKFRFLDTWELRPMNFRTSFIEVSPKSSLRRIVLFIRHRYCVFKNYVEFFSCCKKIYEILVGMQVFYQKHAPRINKLLNNKCLSVCSEIETFFACLHVWMQKKRAMPVYK